MPPPSDTQPGLEKLGSRLPRDLATLPEGFWNQDPEPLAVWLFGSSVTGKRGPEPDLDIALLLGGAARQPAQRLDLVMLWRGRLVDALGSERIDVVVLDGAPVLLRHRAIRDGRLLACRDRAARIEFEAASLWEYCDTEWMRQLFDARLKERLLAAPQRG